MPPFAPQSASLQLIWRPSPQQPSFRSNSPASESSSPVSADASPAALRECAFSPYSSVVLESLASPLAAPLPRPSTLTPSPSRAPAPPQPLHPLQSCCPLGIDKCPIVANPSSLAAGQWVYAVPQM